MTDSPIPIINNTHLELTRIIKLGGEVFTGKRTFYIADIVNIEGYSYTELAERKKCTRIEFKDSAILVTEPYKKVKETWLAWVKFCQEYEKDSPGVE
jgi:uncharacterized LabA/DUF88 family protein